MNNSTEVIYNISLHSRSIEELETIISEVKKRGATDIEFNINYAPAGSRDEGPSLMIFTKSLTDEQIKQKKIAWHQEQIKALEQE